MIAILLIINETDGRKDGVQHCNDKMRELIFDSCKILNAAHKHLRNSRQTHSTIVKRENGIDNMENDTVKRENEIHSSMENDTADFSVEFLENESK